MKIRCIAEMMVLGRNENLSKDGKTKFYNLPVFSVTGNGKDEAGNLPCTENVYKLVTPFQVMKFECEYNTEYKSFKIVSVFIDGEVCGSGSAPTAPTAPPTAPGGNQGKQDKK